MQIISDLDYITKNVKKLFGRLFPVKEELLLIIFPDYPWTYELLREVEEYSKRKRSPKLRISNIEEVKVDFLEPYILKYAMKGSKVIVKDTSGIIKLEFSDGNIMLFVKAPLPHHSGIIWKPIIVTLGATMANFEMISESVLKDMIALPDKGKYELDYEEHRKLIYSAMPLGNDTNIIIPQEESILKTIDNFFDNIDFYTSGKRKGMWVSLFYGPPGTGKSSFCQKIGDLYAKKILVVFATHIAETVDHLLVCAKKDIRTIVILEDADLNLINNNPALLNFFQGHLTPTNKKGAYVIITTNYHNRVEARVLRPGRINMKFYLGNLNEEAAFRCAQGYFKNQYPDFDKIVKNGGYNKILKIFNNLSGAQIEQIFTITDLDLRSVMRKNLTIDDIIKAKEKLIEHELRAAEEEKQNLIKRNDIGF